MRILYLSCHSILEYEEVSLLHELGHDVFSPGAYVEPANPGDATLRPAIDGLIYDEKVLEQWHKICGEHPGEDGKNYLTKEFVDNFDCVIVMHLPRWITNNWQAMKHTRVVWRTIGQSVSTVEAKIKPARIEGLEIVRYSPKEHNIPGFIGEDALIRFYKDPEEYRGWTGHQGSVVTFAQSMRGRGEACSFTAFDTTTVGMPRKLFGPGNEDVSWAGGKLSYERLKEELRNNRVYFYTGTHPASYTLNFMEAWMTGIPVVAVGPHWGNARYFPNHDLYEVPDLIENYSTGFIADDIGELRSYVKLLLDNKEVADVVSIAGRAEAIRHFNKDMIKEAWRSYLGE
jgi:hypothetical protein